jgi:hypothetical protein
MGGLEGRAVGDDASMGGLEGRAVAEAGTNVGAPTPEPQAKEAASSKATIQSIHPLRLAVRGERVFIFILLISWKLQVADTEATDL